MPLSKDGRWSASATPFPLAKKPTLDDGAGHKLKDDDRGLFVLHAVLLHSGKVLCFCGHVEFAYYAPLSYVFDPKNPTDPLKAIPFPAGMDLFCCHYVQLPIGRILVIGGSDMDFMHHGSVGATNICIFNPNENEWLSDKAWRPSRKNGKLNKLIQARWYPTPVMLPDGRVLVVSGRREHLELPPGDPPVIADKVEIISKGGRSRRDWRSEELASAAFNDDELLPIYPGLHLAPNGRVYFTHTTWGQEVDDPITKSIEVKPGATWTPHPDHTPPPATRPLKRREEGMSVLLPLLPPAYQGKILVIGGTRALKANGTPVLQGPLPRGPEAFHSIFSATDATSAEILDTSPATPTWSAAPGSPMKHGRTNGHCVLLPDETVLIVGGHNGYKWQRKPNTQPSLKAEIFTPGSGFREVAEMKDSRMYHSIALLLPDGRVLTAGGADPNFLEPTLTYPSGWAGPKYGVPADPNPMFRGNLPLNQKTFEFYEPPYFFNADDSLASRPVITDVRRGSASTKRLRYGQAFTVVTPQAASIKKVSFMRPGAPTHHTDTEQRYIGLTFTIGTGQLTVKAADNAKLAPPGYYMLWIVDDKGHPCQEAVFIHLVA
jgi:hypothetical protein